MANLSGLSAILLVVTAGVLILLMTQTTPTSAVTYDSHYRTISYTYRVYYRYCTPYYYTYCYRWYYYRCWYRWYWYRWRYCYPYYWYYNPWYGWGRWYYCYRRVSYCCYRRWYTRTGSRRVCRNGWTGSLCNIPVCSPSCGNGQVCLHNSGSNSNYCGCQRRGTGRFCEILPCSLQNNCYPGTCTSGTCDCPSGFGGANCLTISEKPSIGECSATLYAKPTPSSTERAVGTTTCEAEGLAADAVWVGDGLDFSRDDKGITKLEVNWKAEYDNTLSMPSRPQGSRFFVSNAPVPIGITDGNFTISFDGYTSDPEYCRGLSAASPVTATTDHCVLQPSWSSLGVNSQVVNNNTMTITVSNKLGGQKIGDSTYTYGGASYGFRAQTFTSDAATKQAKFRFDLQRPTHCLLENNIADVIDRSANCTVFPIALDEDITSNATITPRILGWTDDESGLDRFEVEVYLLQPGNSGALVQLANPEISTSVKPDQNNFQYFATRPGVYAIVVTVYDEANNWAKARKIFNYNDQPGFEDTGAPIHFVGSNNSSFITEFDDATQTLTLSFAGRFVTKNEQLGSRVEPWPINQNVIDDVYGATFGLRSISAVTGAVGVSSISCVCRIKRNNDEGTDQPELGPSGPESVGNCTTDLERETATLAFTSPIRNGDHVVVWMNVSDHRGETVTVRLQGTADKTRPNISDHEFAVNRDDKYESFMEIEVYDPESGIRSIRYKIVDDITGVVVLEGEEEAQTRLAPGTKRRKRNTDPERPCTADDTTCYCIPEGKCFPNKQEVVIDHCDIDRFKGSDHRLEFRYVVINLAGRETRENKIPMGNIAEVECRPPPGLSAGVIVAIIIGLLLLILLIIIIILMLLRVRKKKHPVPQRFRTMAQHARKRFTMHKDATEDNELYMTGEQPPAYPGPNNPRQVNHHVNPVVTDGTGDDVDDDMYLDRNIVTPGKIPRKQLQMTSTLAEGRFAIVRTAHLDTGKDRSAVAAKALRNGFAKKDEVLMAKKVEFLKDVPPHGNVVRFLGEVEDISGEGPIMVLELCDESLKDWLSKRSTLTTDDLEALLGFALNIARGVQHLHSHKILHRRLGVRNVLLQQQASGLVAKLIGFGPIAEDMDNPSDKSGAGSSAPIKWLAPETLDTLSSKKPKYDEKTDAWSYGITLWEMYSKGAAPFGEVRSADVKAHIKRGNRMTCPRDCPPELFDTVVYPCWNEKASKRPSFSAICQSIDEFRQGGCSQTGYYGREDGDDRGGSQIYDDGY